MCTKSGDVNTYKRQTIVREQTMIYADPSNVFIAELYTTECFF